MALKNLFKPPHLKRFLLALAAAITAAGVDALSNGRAVLGIGASGPQVIEGFHGLEYDAPVTRTREIIEICRTSSRKGA